MEEEFNVFIEKHRKSQFTPGRTARSVLARFTLATLTLLVVSNPLLPSSANAFGLRRINLGPGIPPVAPTPTPPPAPVGAQPQPSGSSCKSPDPEFQCIGIKMVSYLDDVGTAVISEADTLRMIQEMNSVWGTCKIGFQLETYVAVNPTTVGLKYDPYWPTEASSVRAAFSDAQTFLVVSVGTLSSSTIAVTQMPFSSPYGTLVEKDFARNALTVGHELGHYMGLYHYRDLSNLMNPYIGSNTRALSSDQCATARNANTRYWSNMMR